jgi:hypothetical protein
LFNWSGTVSIDRYSDWYYSYAGGGFGKAATFVSGSVTANWLDQLAIPSPTTMNNFLTQHGTNFTAGVWGGVSQSYTPGSGLATGVGFVSPQAGFSYNYSFRGGSFKKRK